MPSQLRGGQGLTPGCPKAGSRQYRARRKEVGDSSTGCLPPAQTGSNCSVWRDMSRLANNPQNTQFSLSVESPEVETRTVEAWAHGRQAGRREGRQAGSLAALRAEAPAPDILVCYTYLFRVYACVWRK